ncbi:MAG TPA: hypothetical protein ENJ60_16350 [Aeromonadales bacterium]|nr:hypothetical protein [Aeromonadales bacterium]
MKYIFLCVKSIIFILFLSTNESLAKNIVDENTLKMGTIYQKIQRAQYLKKICDYFYNDKQNLNLLYAESNINIFEKFVPSKNNALLKAYRDKKQFSMFIKGLSTQQKQILINTCNVEYPKILQKIKVNSIEWFELVKEDMKKAAEKFRKIDAMKN